jgi:hypothetical protein
MFLPVSTHDGAATPTGAQGAALRRPPRACDQALTGTTRRWLRRLPARRRPLHLCARYPRVANRLAWAWDDAARIADLLDELLVDRRGGRRGFPLGVVRELRRLREFNLQQRVETTAQGWWTRLGRVVGWD